MREKPVSNASDLSSPPKYDPKSARAEEFISHKEIMDTLAYAWENRSNGPLIDDIIAKARAGKGLTHREAAVLLDCTIEEKNREIYRLAEEVKEQNLR